MTESIRNHLQEAIQRGYIAAFRILGNADESRDACQEAAAKALASAAHYDTNRPFYPWFYRILKNLCIDRIRQRAHTTPTSDIEIPESRHGAESLLLEHERSHAVLDAVQTLGEEHRDVIELRHFQDLSYEEMAEILECPVGTVMSRLYRARKALREALLTNPDFQSQNAHNTIPHHGGAQ